MKMKKLFKGIAIAGLSFNLMLVGCSSNTYGLTREEYKLVDKYYEADEMVEELKKFGHSDEEIEKQLRAALAQVKFETAN
ncbi:hypothetical protein [Neobacillus sp. FSL H8-0543]|uniref:hypothetical protein n=1 Tax=Neobacillus sp. FSL H8-0543 TaxID=2954672 RepID=UPI003158003F